LATTNYNLDKYNASDVHSLIISKQQDNMDKIDTQMKVNADAVVAEASLRQDGDNTLQNGLDSTNATVAALSGSIVGGTTEIRYNVFTIVHADNGDNTFTYKDTNDVEYTKPLSVEGYQNFDLIDGVEYEVNNNRIEAIINDTLIRSKASGGLDEVSSTRIALTIPETDGTEITFKVFVKLGLIGQHGITHEVDGVDEVEGLAYVSETRPVNNKAVWFKVIP